MTKIYNKIKYLYEYLPPEFSSEEAHQMLSTIYKSSNKFLEALVAKGDLIRLKKGLFDLRDRFEPLAAAGSLHGPSYISFETALSFYGMIPERVESIMSVVDGRQMQFQSDEYVFLYRSQNRKLFAAGMTAVTIRGRNVLIATREKALLDCIIWARPNTKNVTSTEIYNFVCDSYRLGQDDLSKLSKRHFYELTKLCRSLAPMMFYEEWSKLRNKGL